MGRTVIAEEIIDRAVRKGGKLEFVIVGQFDKTRERVVTAASRELR